MPVLCRGNTADAPALITCIGARAQTAPRVRDRVRNRVRVMRTSAHLAEGLVRA